MLPVSKLILPFLILLCCSNLLTAQQNTSVLPSLFDSQVKSNTVTDDTAVETRLKQKMFVKVFTNKNKIFVGEPVMATYKFYVAMQISNQPSITKQPEFTTCSVKELNFDQGPELEQINNESYSVYTFRKFQLMHLQHGMF